ncbi:MAG TPA: DNA gyrase subunit A [bacterium]|nr:DNA gyrase subunit A [bacterium]HQL61293.1 DNA gyrase subunit A [bacterium]
MLNPPSERIRSINIEDEMRTSYISYAMSVIIQRALPDARDGLKPVHRRVIYAMRDLNLNHRAPFKKSAAIVGETMGKYHPHGDAAIYDTLVRMAQEFAYRYPLVDGQGNFGSVDGDSPAAMRYTEARMKEITETLLTDIEKETVEFMPNYDGSVNEPVVLPAEFPNLLVNGSTGIAVGMATNIPPHNLGEIIDATVALIDNPELKVRDLFKYVKGPDFPTGACICGVEGIHEAYSTGRGRVLVRAVAQREVLSGNREAIVITEIPYMVNKAKVLEELAELVREKKIEGISDLRDESDRDGMRMVIELKRGENHEVVLNNLYKHTRLQSTFGIILLALVDGRPQYLTLKDALMEFIKHRREVIVRRTRFDLARAEQRAHIVEGLRIAVMNIDEVVAIIRSSRSREEAATRLRERFDLSAEQTKAILEMQLQRLVGLEREKLENEYNELIKSIDYFRRVLETPAMVMDIAKKELLRIKERFGDARRTQIVGAAGDIDVEDLIAEENMVVTVSHTGYIKRIATSVYHRQGRGGKGITAMGTKDTDFVEHLFVASTHNYILFFTDRGRAYWLKVYEIPQGGRQSKGKAIVNLISLEKEEQVTAMVPVADFQADRFLLMATERGTVKKVRLDAFSNPRKVGIIAIDLEENDRLLGVQMTTGTDEVILSTEQGMAIRFDERDVRPMGRTARGVLGVNLAEGDRVIGMVATRADSQLLTVTENGYGKRTPVEAYRKIRRGGKGVIDIQTSKRNGKVVAVMEVRGNDEIMMITQKGMAIRTPVAGIREISRNTQGVRLIRLNDDDRVVAAAKICETNGVNGNGNGSSNDNGNDNNNGTDEEIPNGIETEENGVTE